MRTCLSLAAALAASLALTSTAASAGSTVDLTVIDRDTGAVLPTYTDHGRAYVAGTPGHRYAVRLFNRSGARVLAVLSVDGVNAVSGETANPDQTGYVLDARQSAEITGWRKNLDEVAGFNFTALPDSYAARTGRPDNVGVIGVAVFTERERPREALAKAAPAQDAAEGPARPSSAAPAPGAQSSNARAAAPQERLGTGHGAREYAHVDTTSFERASDRPVESTSVWYDSYANLVQRGIVPRAIARNVPQAFPGGFVPDPAPR